MLIQHNPPGYLVHTGADLGANVSLNWSGCLELGLSSRACTCGGESSVEQPRGWPSHCRPLWAESFTLHGDLSFPVTVFKSWPAACLISAPWVGKEMTHVMNIMVEGLGFLVSKKGRLSESNGTTWSTVTAEGFMGFPTPDLGLKGSCYRDVGSNFPSGNSSLTQMWAESQGDELLDGGGDIHMEDAMWPLNCGVVKGNS